MEPYLPKHQARKTEGIRACYFWARSYRQSRQALSRYFPDAELVYTGDDDGKYWLELSARWEGSGELLVIEHDTVLHDQVRPQLEACAEDWCEFPYPARDGSGSLHSMCLGCTRFSSALRSAVPSEAIIAAASEMTFLGRGWAAPGVLRWPWIDPPVQAALRAAGYTCHTHEPPVGHIAHRDHDAEVLW